MDWIKENINKKIILWGRSMGAVCCVRYQNFYGNAQELVVDSPFHNLMELFATKLYDITFLPAFLARSGVKLMSKTLS